MSGARAKPDDLDPARIPVEGADDPGALTILRPDAAGLLATKAYTVAPNGKVARREWGNAKFFRAEVARAGDIHELHRLLCDLVEDPRALVIRAAPTLATALHHCQRKLTGNGPGGSFVDVPRRWFMWDADGVPLPAGSSVIADPEDVARHLVDLVVTHAPELEGVTAVVKFSSSAGVAEMAAADPERWGGFAKPDAAETISGHIWFYLAEPQAEAALTRWAKAINAGAGFKVADPRTLLAVQPHYTAAPVFEGGLRDPLRGRRVVLVRGSEDAATLDIPLPPKPGERPMGEASAFAGMGFGERLAAIGHPVHGFHGPINSAIARYVSDNWPHPDEGALIEALQAAIRAADPGGRTTAQIDRYADAEGLRQRIAWVVQKHAAGMEAEAVERARAEAVEPTFPDRSVTRAEGARLAQAVVADLAARVRAGESPRHMLRITVGGGKSEAAVKGAVALLDAARAAAVDADKPPALYYLVPRHDLGSEIVERIRKAHPGRTVAVWRGMDADDPEAAGKSMCLDPELPKAAKAAGIGASEACTVCPLRAECGYRRQRKQKGDIWAAAHNLAFGAKPSALPPAGFVVIDEGFYGAGLRGLDGHAPMLAISALDERRTGKLDRASAERLLYLRHKAATALRAHLGKEPDAFAGLAGRVAVERGGIRRDAFEAAGMTAEMAGEWKQLEWDTRPKAELSAGMDRDAILARLGELTADGFTRMQPMLAGFVAEMLAGDAHRSVNAEFVPDAELGRGMGTGPAVRFAWREGFAKWCVGAPKLFLDATTAPEIARLWEPDLAVTDIEIAAPNQRVRQVAGPAEFGRSFFVPSGQKRPREPGEDESEDAEASPNVRRLADLAVTEAAAAGSGSVLIVAQQEVEAHLRAELERRFGGEIPARIHLAHHGALTGMDKWRGVARLVVVGRPAVNRTAGERMAEILRGAAVEVVQDGDRSRWPETRAGIRMADGTGAVVEQPRHPDPLVEAVRWTITEGAVLQALGRGRGVQRDKPLHVTLLCKLALPLMVAEVATWHDALPERVTVAAAEAALTGRALPLAAADLAAARPDLWRSAKAAECDLARAARVNPQTPYEYVSYKGFEGLLPARYRKAGAFRWSEALVPPGAPRAALEAVIAGELVGFEMVEAGAKPGGDRASAPSPEPEAEPAAPPGDVPEGGPPQERARKAAEAGAGFGRVIIPPVAPSRLSGFRSLAAGDPLRPPYGWRSAAGEAPPGASGRSWGRA